MIYDDTFDDIYWIKFRGTLFFVKTIDTKSPKISVPVPKELSSETNGLEVPPLKPTFLTYSSDGWVKRGLPYIHSKGIIYIYVYILIV